jgi:hypothetical protein
VKVIHIRPLSGAKADVVEPDPALIKALALLPRTRTAQTEGRAATDAVKESLSVQDGLHAEKREQLRIEGPGAREITSGNEGMRDAVDFHGMSPLLSFPLSTFFLSLFSRVSSLPACS